MIFAMPILGMPLEKFEELMQSDYGPKYELINGEIKFRKEDLDEWHDHTPLPQ